MIKKLHLWLQNNWIFCSVAITITPLVIKGFVDLADIKNMLVSNFEMSKKIAPLLPQINQLVITEDSIKYGIRNLKLGQDSNRQSIKRLSGITEQHIIKDAKTKEDLLNAIKEFGPYWNVNYNPDSSKKKICLQWVK